MMSKRFVAALCWVAVVSAFAPSSSLRTLLGRSHHTTLRLGVVESNEELIHDIEVLEDEAKHRLQNLMHQMDELESFQQETKAVLVENDPSRTHSLHNESNEKKARTHEEKKVRQSQSSSTKTHLERSSGATNKSHSEHTNVLLHAPPTKKDKRTRKSKHIEIIKERPLNLLQDTSWKIVFNIGREEGTWMPSHWGKSGARLRMEVHCTFTSEIVPEENNDPFFAHSALPVHYVAIEEAFAWPTDVGVGRKPLQMDPKGGKYQICPGEGPAGTDLLRLMIPIPVNLRKEDVTLTAGNVYGTTGYFGHPDQGRQQVIDAVQEEYEACVAECDRAERELANTENVIAWAKARRSLWNAERELDEAVKRVTLTGQHYPDHAHMRTDPTGRVGLAKEGGLCIQVHTGLAMEYHILGRMEVGHFKH